MYIYINVDVCTSILIWVRVIRINATFNNISLYQDVSKAFAETTVLTLICHFMGEKTLGFHYFLFKEER